MPRDPGLLRLHLCLLSASKEGAGALLNASAVLFVSSKTVSVAEHQPAQSTQPDQFENLKTVTSTSRLFTLHAL